MAAGWTNALLLLSVVSAVHLRNTSFGTHTACCPMTSGEFFFEVKLLDSEAHSYRQDQGIVSWPLETRAKFTLYLYPCYFTVLCFIFSVKETLLALILSAIIVFLISFPQLSNLCYFQPIWCLLNILRCRTTVTNN